MTLLEDVALSDGRRRCGVAAILTDLDESDPTLAEEVREVLQAKGVASNPAVARVIRDRGFHVTARIIERHRNGECSCQ